MIIKPDKQDIPCGVKARQLSSVWGRGRKKQCLQNKKMKDLTVYTGPYQGHHRQCAVIPLQGTRIIVQLRIIYFSEPQLTRRKESFSRYHR